MRPYRILVVDDATIARQMISRALSVEPRLEVVGTASNGRIALDKIQQLKPDLMILDIEMPEMNGMQVLSELRKAASRLPVVMFSTLTERGAAATLDALVLGADDWVTKPVDVDGPEAAIQQIREELVPKILALCARREQLQQVASKRPGLKRPRSSSAASAQRRGPGRVDIVAIGVSTGGPAALFEILRHFPAGFPVPIVIVQHLQPLFTKLLTERLNTQLPLPIREGVSGSSLHDSAVWMAPGGFHMLLEQEPAGVMIRLNQDPPENSCRPSVDVLFRSVAKLYGENSLAVILTGMGQDGLKGCEQIYKAGGQILAQDEASSVVWGMAGNVVRAGLADGVLPLEQIAEEIQKRTSLVRNTYYAGSAE